MNGELTLTLLVITLVGYMAWYLTNESRKERWAKAVADIKLVPGTFVYIGDLEGFSSAGCTVGVITRTAKTHPELTFLYEIVFEHRSGSGMNLIPMYTNWTVTTLQEDIRKWKQEKYWMGEKICEYFINDRVLDRRLLSHALCDHKTVEKAKFEPAVAKAVAEIFPHIQLYIHQFKLTSIIPHTYLKSFTSYMDDERNVEITDSCLLVLWDFKPEIGDSVMIVKGVQGQISEAYVNNKLAYVDIHSLNPQPGKLHNMVNLPTNP